MSIAHKIEQKHASASVFDITEAAKFFRHSLYRQEFSPPRKDNFLLHNKHRNTSAIYVQTQSTCDTFPLLSFVF